MGTSNLVLPRFVTFMFDNGSYLTHRNAEDLEIDGGEFDRSRGAVHEVFHEGTDIVTIRSVQNQRFWRRHASAWTSNQIQASGGSRPAANDLDGRFRVFLLNTTDVAVMAMGNQQFCRRFTQRNTNKLRAIDSGSPSIQFGRLTVGEPVTSRQMRDIVYHLHDATVSDERPLVHTTVELSNSTTNLTTDLEFALTYERSTTSSWSNSVTTGQSMAVSITGGVPIIGVDLEVEVGASTSRTTEWGAVTTTVTTSTIGFEVEDVPPGHRVNLSVLSTEAEVTVPFSYRLRDIWSSGSTQEYDRSDGVFHGANSFNTHLHAQDTDTGASYGVVIKEIDDATVATGSEQTAPM